MFAIGFLLMFILSFIESFNMKKISEQTDVKNFMTLILSFSGFIISVASYFISTEISQEPMDISKEVALYYNPVFYFALLSEITGFWLARKNFEVNSSNMTAINFSLFFSLSLVPIYTFFFSGLYGFSDTLKINYESNIELFAFIGGMTLLTIVYFFDKVKGKIDHILWLIPFPLVLSNSMFLTGNLMQQYNGFFAYGSIALVLSLFFLSIAIKNKELKNLNKGHAKLAGFIFLGWCIAIPANTIAIKILAIEFVNLLKRLSQILVGVILDKLYKNNTKRHWKDKYIIALMFIFGFGFYYFRG
jgi:hypothetical protein